MTDMGADQKIGRRAVYVCDPPPLSSLAALQILRSRLRRKLEATPPPSRFLRSVARCATRSVCIVSPGDSAKAILDLPIAALRLPKDMIDAFASLTLSEWANWSQNRGRR